ncbi:hypothetical protein [Oricola thermophila]|uniref:Uncharacterized protein n=1 Tax=Oricola thermophila TaxID=2742145 RepID=A0A6N1VM13_9HYPH|nr:hypothetical protein [Oricola thermophila]QKV20269.1 hypothetical protein HTY61_18320 [Oricola thermophila]
MANPKLAEMDLFTVIPDARVIVSEKGVYRQVPLYQRAGGLYAEHRSGFARLIVGGSTSVPAMRWEEVVGVELENDKPAPRERIKATGLRLAAPHAVIEHRAGE